MAYLNTQERTELLNDLLKMDNFNKVRRKLRRMDPKVKLSYFRNVQDVNKWVTRYELPSRGTIVTLIESQALDGEGKLREMNFELKEVIVEATPENRT